MELLISTGLILVLIFMGMSVPFCFLSGSLFYAFLSGASTGGYVSTAFNAHTHGVLAIPLFMIAGTLIEKSGIAKTLIDLGELMLRRFKGGMGATIPVVSAFFGALSGSGTATVTTMGTMLTPRLEELGWDRRYLSAFIAAAGPLGYMIPPNMNAIIYTTVSSASVAALFLATVIPGIIWLALYLIINRLTYKQWYKVPESVEKQTVQSSLNDPALMEPVKKTSSLSIVIDSIPAFLMPVIIMGGIYSGIFSATEAGAVGCLYALIVGIAYYKKIKLRDVFKTFLNTGNSLGSILIMFPMTLMFSRILVVNNVPAMLTEFITGFSTNRLVILLIIDIVLIFAGCFLDVGVLLLVFTPLLLPTASLIGLTQVQLGVMMFVAVGVGTITPPMAMNLFIAGKICDVELKDMLKPLVPFLLFAALPMMFLVTYFPELSLWLPRLVLGAIN
ncbi:TRAP transporter large permease [Alkalibacter rhizosphaerae]|uniref:TRAP transporter large permease n=1 Tax=Alkalibacter rhizosphaerae TaxID=2815577 RepID=A0A974XI94_9FIRM|nr:TRAP transporter large permease [Alkalibacter rhizosphaerae]QSX09240.1 TRAP transporter large permease [Alkalibacter rhizosphaerae]